MEQTYGFFGFILYLLTFLGCNSETSSRADSSDSSSVTEEAVEEKTVVDIKNTQHGTDYYISLEKWNQAKETHNNSYAYTLSLTSGEGGFTLLTTVTVQNGIIYSQERKVDYWHSDPNHKTPLKKEGWIENQKQLGTHGETPKTMDEFYEDCAKILTVDPKVHEIVFTMNDKQLMSACGSTHEACADGCFKGVRITDFKWLD